MVVCCVFLGWVCDFVGGVVDGVFFGVVVVVCVVFGVVCEMV